MKWDFAANGNQSYEQVPETSGDIRPISIAHAFSDYALILG